MVALANESAANCHVPADIVAAWTDKDDGPVRDGASIGCGDESITMRRRQVAGLIARIRADVRRSLQSGDRKRHGVLSLSVAQHCEPRESGSRTARVGCMVPALAIPPRSWTLGCTDVPGGNSVRRTFLTKVMRSRTIVTPSTSTPSGEAVRWTTTDLARTKVSVTIEVVLDLIRAHVWMRVWTCVWPRSHDMLDFGFCSGFAPHFVRWMFAQTGSVRKRRGDGMVTPRRDGT